MAIPDYQACMLPLVKLARDRDDHALKDAVPTLADQFQLTDAEKCHRSKLNQPTNGRNDPASGFGVRHFEKIGIFLSNKPDSKDLRRVCLEEKCRLTSIMVAGSFRPLLAGLK
jgi:hypothetical protein